MARKKKRSAIVPMAKKSAAAATGGKFLTWEEDDRVGAFPPFGYWDPFGLATQTTAGELAYFREAELKHGRVCMLASVGFIVQERFHPLFGGEIDVPALQAPAQVELQLFWPAVLAVTGGIEILTGGRGEETEGAGLTPSLKEGLIPGDLGFDPLGLSKNFNDEEFVDIQNKELAHGRFAMITALGMILQELVIPDQKLYGA